MALQATTNINVDFYDKDYILINAKQLDRGVKILDEGVDTEGEEYSRWLDSGSRFLTIACYNQGKPIIFNSGEHAAYIRYKKPDGYGVFNFCTIDRQGRIIVGLTEQMLASEGICVADLVIVDKGKAEVNLDTGEIININETSVLSTMPIHIDVTEIPINNSDIESTYEFNLLNTKLEEYWADFEDVVKTSKSWAVGNSGLESRKDIENTDNSMYYSQLSKSYAIGHTDGDIRENEDVDNSKYYSEQSSDSADYSKSYAVGGTGTRDGEDVDNAEYYSQVSKSYAIGGTGIGARDGEDVDNAEYYSRLAKSYTIGSSEGSTGTRDDESTENAKTYMENAADSKEKALSSQNEALVSEHNAEVWATGGYLRTHINGTVSTLKITGAEKSAEQAANSATISQRYAVGGTGTVDGEDEDNAKWYWNQSVALADNATKSATESKNNANKAQSYAVGGTGTRENEDYDNAHYYYELMKNIVIGIDSGFIPQGTVAFSELASVEKATGYVYNISDDFITDDTFREGAGKSYTAGTNVYFCANGLWDCFGGAASPTATVSEVKDYLGI